MQFIVFAAFAIVLSVPKDGPPWQTIESTPWTLLIVAGQVLLPVALGLWYTRAVKKRLENQPQWLPTAQARLADGAFATRTALAVGFAAGVYLTSWTQVVRGWSWAEPIWGLGDLLIMLPFFVGVLAVWIVMFPADRAVRSVSLELRLWASEPTRPVWGLGKYLSFMFRQHVLIIAAPMVPIVVAYDFATRYRDRIVELTGVYWAHEAVIVVMAGLVFLIAPVLLCYIWHTRELPPSDLRERLQKLCDRVNLRYRRILIWESDGMMINAAVMGLFKPVRYILLSDGLLEMMKDEQIEAVFGHEAGHVKHHHIQFFLLFAILSMLIVGGITQGAMWLRDYWPSWITLTNAQAQDYLQVIAMSLIVALWGLGFGVVSRRFEWQADLFGAKSVTPDANACQKPCFYHGTAPADEHSPGKPGAPVCTTAAQLFADSLERIAILNGIPIEARSWRHSSIGNRIRRLKRYAIDPSSSAQLGQAVMRIKTVLLIGTLIGLAIAAFLYIPPLQEWVLAQISS